MSIVDELVAQAKEYLGERETVTVPVKFEGGKHAGVRFLPMAGADWNDLTLRYPPRPGVVQDLNLGYDLTELVAQYPDIVLLVNDEVVDLGEGEESRWPEIFSVLDGPSRKNLATEIWDAHEHAADALIVSAGKA